MIREMVEELVGASNQISIAAAASGVLIETMMLMEGIVTNVKSESG